MGLQSNLYLGDHDDQRQLTTQLGVSQPYLETQAMWIGGSDLCIAFRLKIEGSMSSVFQEGEQTLYTYGCFH